ncbi:MAG: hypothetical protein IJ576_02700 [Synergistaceae bacterium]|nr:hypothetical protein [Synergistaceae bacterium]
MQTLERVLRNLFQDNIDAELASERNEGIAIGIARERQDAIKRLIAIGWSAKDAARFVGEV